MASSHNDTGIGARTSFPSNAVAASASSSSRPHDGKDGVGVDVSDALVAADDKDGDGDELDFLGDDDPLEAGHPGLAEPVSFKRRQKPGTGLFGADAARFLASIPGLGGLVSTGGAEGRGGPQSRPQAGGTSPLLLHGLEPPQTGSNGGPVGGADQQQPHYPGQNASKDGGQPLDWYVEGPGRRVGYEDLTAIDWIFEYTKERQRLRVLYSSVSGLLGHIRVLADASQVWVVLVLTGLAVGTVAAAIDITTNWLGDLKSGFCSAASNDAGAFYLNKNFCCYGYDEWSNCDGWKPWSRALGIHSAGGKWFVEYFFFLILSVSRVDAALGCYRVSSVWFAASRC